MSLKDYDEIMRTQGSRCAICLTDLTQVRVVIDHDHATGMVRGLLCYACNSGLGLFRDNTQSLQRAIEYLALAAENNRIREEFFKRNIVTHERESTLQEILQLTKQN